MYHPPRALLRRHNIVVELTPTEIYDLIKVINARAVRAADHFEQVGYADHLFQRVAALREAAR